MVMPPGGTFDYFVTVPNDSSDTSFPWAVKHRESGQRAVYGVDSRLVGLSPNLHITSAGLTPDTLLSGPTSERLPKVLRSQFTLIAPDKTGATVARASFFVEKGLISLLRPQDVLYMARTNCGGLGVSVVRNGQLVVAAGAVTAVPLGNVEAHVTWELIQEAEAFFRRRDSDFDFPELPVEVKIGADRRVLFRGWPQIGRYKVFVAHGFLRGEPGTQECMGISQVGVCPETTASCSAMLLDSSHALEIVNW